MAKECFVPRDFKPDALAVIENANTVIAEYQEQGFVLTLRQLYYQFVSRVLFPEDRKWRLVGSNKWVPDSNGTPNATPNYKWLASIINDARLAGLVDWAAFEDRTRNVEHTASWESPAAILEVVGEQYKRDPWENQKYRPEVWVEKEALAGVIERVCERWRVPRLACRGYMSQSEQYAAGKRFARYHDDGLIPIVLHLGDHDPSGMNMTEDNRDRLGMFAGADVELRRLALNMDQVRRYNPPPNPAKETDSRFRGYRDQFGDESWELDALDPRTIDGIIDREIRDLVDKPAWDAVMKEENRERESLANAADRWEDVVEFLES